MKGVVISSAILAALFISAASAIEKKPNAQPNVAVVSFTDACEFQRGFRVVRL